MLGSQEVQTGGHALGGSTETPFFPLPRHVWLPQSIVPGDFTVPERNRVTEITR